MANWPRRQPHFSGGGVMRSWKSFSKKDRCPICSPHGRKGDAPCGHDGNRIEIVCTKALELGIQKGDQEGDYVAMKEVGGVQPGMFFVHQDHLKHDPNAPKKKQRKPQTREWVYRNKQGDPVVKVKRIDDENGKRIFQSRMTSKGHWTNGLGDLTHEDWVVLNYHKAVEARKQGKQIGILEGESCADVLESIKGLDIVPISFKGGTSGFNAYQLEFLIGYGHNTILFPDMDQPGVELMRKVQEVIGPCQWAYTDPDRGTWNRLPAAGGEDIVDWVEKGATKEQILAAIGPEREDVGRSNAAEQGNLFDQGAIAAKQINPRQDADDLKAQLMDLATQDLDGFDLDIELSKIASQFKKQPRNIRSLYLKVVDKLESAHEINEIEPEIYELLSGKKRQVDVYKIFHPKIAKAINLTDKKHLHGAASLALLSITGTLAKDVGIQLKNDWHERLIFYNLIIGASSIGKSRIMSKIMKPLRLMQEDINEETARLKEKLEEVEPEWQSLDRNEKRERKGTEEDPNHLKKLIHNQRLYFMDGTPEALDSYTARQPKGFGVLHYGDEASSVFDFDAYKTNSRKSKKDRMTAWGNGKQGAVRRQDLTKCYDFKGQRINILAGIQPKSLKENFPDFNVDRDGELSRLLKILIEEPSLSEKLKWDETTVDVSDVLLSIYKKVESFPDNVICRISRQAKEKFKKERERYITWQYRNRETKPAFAQWIAKMVSHLARTALALHILDCACDEGKDKLLVTEETMDRAIYFANILIANERHLQTIVTGCNESFKETKDRLLGKVHDIFEFIKTKGCTTLLAIRRKFQTRGRKKGINKKEAIAYVEQLERVTEKSTGLKGFVQLSRNDKGEITGIEYIEGEGGNGGSGGNGNGSTPPSNPEPGMSDFQMVVESKQYAEQVALPPPLSDPILEANHEPVSVGMVEQRSTEIATNSVAVLEKPPETQPTTAKGFGDAQTPVKVSTPQDDRDNPRFDSFKKTGSLYRIVKDHDNSSVLLTDEFIGFENTSKKIGSDPLKLKSVQCVVERISLEPQIYLVEELRYQNEEGKKVVLNTCPPGQIHSPLIHSPEVPLDQVIVFVYSDGVRDS
ncbi:MULTISPECIES: DUF3987 domain-containing protein [unclassified Moorena]|uniref:DUF3987 domain-containing protein n=1 Tax=unclassified Moorena TaxID=2683338 RepID=UPI0025D9DA8B|nr:MULTISPECIES: DUF3987 domain-containing protein [unclassified Moorena]